MLIVVMVEIFEWAPIVEPRLESWLIAGDGSKLVNPKIDGSNEVRVNYGLFDLLLINHFNDVG